MFIAPVAAIIPAAATSSALTYVGIKLSTGKAKDISWLTYVLTVIFLIKFFIAV